MSTSQQSWWSRTWDTARDTARVGTREPRAEGERHWRDRWIKVVKETPGKTRGAAQKGWRFTKDSMNEAEGAVRQSIFYARSKAAQAGHAGAKAAAAARAKGAERARWALARQRGARMPEKLVERSAMSVASREPARASDRNWQAGYVAAASNRIPSMRAAAKPMVLEAERSPEPQQRARAPERAPRGRTAPQPQMEIGG